MDDQLNPLFHAVEPDKTLGNPLMGPDGPGPAHGEHFYNPSPFKAPKPDVSDDTPPDLPTAA